MSLLVSVLSGWLCYLGSKCETQGSKFEMCLGTETSAFFKERCDFLLQSRQMLQVEIAQVVSKGNRLESLVDEKTPEQFLNLKFCGKCQPC